MNECELFIATMYMAGKQFLLDEALLQRARARTRGSHKRHVLVARDTFGVRLEIWRHSVELLLLWVQHGFRLAFKAGKHDALADGSALRRDNEINLGVVRVGRAEHQTIRGDIAKLTWLDVDNDANARAFHLLLRLKRAQTTANLANTLLAEVDVFTPELFRPRMLPRLFNYADANVQDG